MAFVQPSELEIFGREILKLAKKEGWTNHAKMTAIEAYCHKTLRNLERIRRVREARDKIQKESEAGLRQTGGVVQNPAAGDSGDT
jgi:hypothetical protein